MTAKSVVIRPISEFHAEVFGPLTEKATEEGFSFLSRLVSDWRCRTNRFDQPGECLLGAFYGETLVAVGGLNRDPYLGKPTIGRVRHAYVHPDWRRRGIGATLICSVLTRAQSHFSTVRLRTDTPSASAFYRRLGFRETT